MCSWDSNSCLNQVWPEVSCSLPLGFIISIAYKLKGLNETISASFQLQFFIPIDLLIHIHNFIFPQENVLPSLPPPISPKFSMIQVFPQKFQKVREIGTAKNFSSWNLPVALIQSNNIKSEGKKSISPSWCPGWERCHLLVSHFY